MTKLKPCPFCGGPAKIIKTTGYDSHSICLPLVLTNTFLVRCKRCGISTQRYQNHVYISADTGEIIYKQDGSEKAIDTWNRRTNDVD